MGCQTTEGGGKSQAKPEKTAALLLRWQSLPVLQRIRVQRFGKAVFLPEPFSQINLLAPRGAKGAKWLLKKIALAPANGTTDHGGHRILPPYAA